jgi:hypothetical protein
MGEELSTLSKLSGNSPPPKWETGLDKWKGGSQFSSSSILSSPPCLKARIGMKHRKKYEKSLQKKLSSFPPEQKLSVVLLLKNSTGGEELLQQLANKQKRVTREEKKALKKAFQESASPLLEHLERLMAEGESITYRCAEYLNSISITAPVRIIRELSRREDVEDIINDQPVYSLEPVRGESRLRSIGEPGSPTLPVETKSRSM